MPSNRGAILRALGKKKKFQKKDVKVNNDSDSDGNISDDDVDELENDYLGQIVNEQYILIKYIGRGTFSRIWLVHDLILDKYLIFKIYFDNNDDSEFKLELETLQKLKAETQCEYNINYNGFLIHKFLNETSSCKILILPYLGMALSDLIDETGSISIKESKYIIKQILYGLKELHQRSILHTDLKMDNILSNHYFDKNEEFTDWFSSLNITSQYKSFLDFHTPDDDIMGQYDKNKRKKIKKKVKKKAITDLTSYVKKQLNNYDTKILGLDEIDLNNNSSNDKIVENNNSIIDLNDNISDNITDNLEIESINLNSQVNQNNKEVNNDNSICNFKFTLTDYSNATSINDIDFDTYYQIRAYRSPEDILGFEYSYKSELWAVGCILWDILTDEYLFEPELKGDSLSRDRKQLALMEKYLGRIPKDLSLDCERSYELFEQSGRIKKNRKVEKEPLEMKLFSSRPKLTEEEISSTCHFLRKIWTYDTKLRPNLEELLDDPYLNN